MKNWFTIEKIDKDTYSISEYQHWEETHCYLLCGKKSAVLIDTGLGVANIKEICDTLTSLPITVVTTHVHWDHVGGHKYFNTIAVHELEVDWLSKKFPLSLQEVKSNLVQKHCIFPSQFNLNEYQIFQGIPHIVLDDKDCIDLGDRKLIVIHTPGHSPGHCCFFEPDRKYLYAGDLLYEGCLDAFYPTTDPLLFYHSVKKILSLDIVKVFPGHHQLHIPVDIVGKIALAFEQLAAEGKLKQGAGVFDFDSFQFHI